MDVNDRELVGPLAPAVSSSMRLTFACIAIAVGLLFCYFALDKRLPPREELSHYQIKPLSFGTLVAGARFRNSNSPVATTKNEIGYVFSISGDALPPKYDKTAPPPIYESPYEYQNKPRNLLFHESLALSDAEVLQLSGLVGKIVEVWFWEAKIILIQANGVDILSYERAKSGLQKQFQMQWVWAAISLLVGILLFLYPRLLAKFKK